MSEQELIEDDASTDHAPAGRKKPGGPQPGDPAASAASAARAGAAGKGRARGGVRTPSAEIRAALVDAAEAVLVRDGPGGVTVRAVAAEAGVAPMGVYNRFGSKHGLFDALLQRAFAGLAAALKADPVPDPSERLRLSGLAYRRFARENPQLYALMFGAQPDQDEAFSAELEECATSAFGALVDQVAYAMAAGVLKDGDPVDVAHQVWSVVHGAVSLELAGRLPVDPDANYDKVLELVVRGLGA